MNHPRRILFASLDWGLGHASRSVPLIRKYLSDGHEVVLASAGEALAFYKIYFPECTVIEKPAYNIRYSKGNSLALSLLLQLPSFFRTIREEQRWLERILVEYHPDEVISDNCYGMWNKKFKSTLITHQLRVICPPALKFTERFVNARLLKWINRFDECLVPDLEGDYNYGGILSHPAILPKRVRYTGLLSRFSLEPLPQYVDRFELTALISGPEPQRTMLEDKIVQIVTPLKIKTCIVRGLPAAASIKYDSKEITWHNHADDSRLSGLIRNSDLVICRAGYSTIMDLVALDASALLVPTPGQTEQEYLAMHNRDKKNFRFVEQSFLDTERIMKEIDRCRKKFKDSLGVQNNAGRGNDIALM